MRANPLIQKLKGVVDLPPEDLAAIDAMCLERVRRVPARRDIIRDGDEPEDVYLIVEGWAARYKVLPDGSRQILAFLIPGDFCDLHVAVLQRMDHGIIALTPCVVAYLDSDKLDRLTSERPVLTKGLWWMTLVDEAVLRQWVVNVGRRDAVEGLAHILCELHVRLRAVGLVEDGSFDLPITQEELADALGMTPVHINRILQRLRADGLIELKSRVLTILDVQRLREVGGFADDYLHIRKRSREPA
ncbi:MAG: Crp/Fnr family transcriptional regulator [Allosphingosinicella sp.]